MLRDFHEARRDGRSFWWPVPRLRRPRFERPADVKPRSSRCFMVGRQIQLMCGSLRMAAWLGSTRMTSKYLYVASCWNTKECCVSYCLSVCPSFDMQ